MRQESNWNRNHYDECLKCKCNSCSTLLSCNSCEKCVGDVPDKSEHNLSKFKEECCNFSYGASPKAPNELNSAQIARIDEIDNSVFDMLKIMCNDQELNWNMELIGEVSDIVAQLLTKKGYQIYFPTITYDENGIGTISDFYPS